MPSYDPGSRVYCGSCGVSSEPTARFCSGCWARLEGRTVTAEEGRLILEADRRSRQRGRRLYVSIVVLVLLALVASLALYMGGPYLLVPEPESTLTSVSGPQSWAMFQGDPGRSGYMAAQPPRLKGDLIWTFKTREFLTTAPVVDQGRVFISTEDRRVIALSAADGQPLWEFPATGPVSSVPAIVDNTLYVGLLDGRVMALDTGNGKTLWEFHTGRPIISSPVVYKGTVFVGSGNSNLYALDAVTGKKLWVYKAGFLVNSPPAVNDKVVAIVSSDQQIHIVNREIGRGRLTYLVVSPVHSSLAIDGEYVYAAVADGRLLAIDWRKVEYPLEKRFILRTKLQLYFWGFLKEQPKQKGFAWVFRPPKGAIRGSPAVTSELVYFGTSQGSLYAVHRSNGELKWEAILGSRIEASPVVIGDTIFVGTMDGFLYSLDAQAGTVLQRLSLPGPLSKGLAVVGDVVYGATTDGTVFALR